MASVIEPGSPRYRPPSEVSKHTCLLPGPLCAELRLHREHSYFCVRHTSFLALPAKPEPAPTARAPPPQPKPRPHGQSPAPTALLGAPNFCQPCTITMQVGQMPAEKAMALEWLRVSSEW